MRSVGARGVSTSVERTRAVTPFPPDLRDLAPDELQRRIDRLSPSDLAELDALVLSLERDALHLRHRQDPLAFAHEVLPHHFSLATARLHEEIVRLVFPTMEDARPHDATGSESRASSGILSLPCSSSLPVPSNISQQNPQLSVMQTRNPHLVAIAAPRGFAKSTLCSFLLPLWSICHDENHFIILISNTQAQAKKFLQMIRYEFETNGPLKQRYPALAPHKDKWSDEEIEVKRHGKLAHKIVAIGAGAQLRGLRFLQYRPDLIILDDIENEELVDSEIRREDLKAWLDRTVLHVNAKAAIVVIGTVLHEVSLLNRLVRQALDEDKRSYGRWTRRVFQAIELERSTWEAYQSTDSLHALREQDPESFNQEKQNEPVGLGYKSFDKPEFWTERRWRGDWPAELAISITCDPACTDKEYSDETAISIAGWDSRARLWSLDLEHNKYTEPDQIIERLLAHYLRWTEHEKSHPTHRFVAVGIEKIAFQKYLISQFKQICRLRHLHPHVVELKGDRDKTRRIRQLVPLFVQDRIFLRPEQTYLEHQLRAFPKGRYDDCGDALAYHLQFGHRLQSPAPTEPIVAPTTFKDYVDMAEAWKLERERLAPFNVDVTFIPRLFN